MKRFVLTVCALLTASLTAWAQNVDCLGLKNPTNFTFTGGTANSLWTGFTGSKNATASTCSTMGSTFSNTVLAASLESTNNTDGCTIGLETSARTLSVNIHNQTDHSNQFVIKGSGFDPETHNRLSYLPPDPSFTSSIRLGNYCGNHGAEMLTYEFNVNLNNSLVTIWYALSLQNGQHSAAENPEFVITVEKQVGSTWQLAGGDTLCYIRPTPVGQTQSVAPFYLGATGQQSTTGTASSIYGDNIYLPWNKVIINLNNLLYQRVRIKIAAGDCSMSQHYACCYIAGECQPMKLNANGCAAGETDDVARITAPKGAMNYEWYRSRTGKLSGADRENDANYVLIGNANDSILNVTVNHFINNTNPTHPDTVTQNTFMCKMTTRMNETLPITSAIYTDVGNTKPRLSIDTMLACDASLTLRDMSVTPYSTRDSDLVDTSKTKWYFYNSTIVSPQTFADSAQGGQVTHQFPAGGNYSVRVRTSAVDPTCWNEKTVQVRTVKAPEPAIRLERDNLCKGDAIAIYDETPGAAYREWIIHRPDGDTVLYPPTAACQVTFNETTNITLRTRTNTYFMADTNGDGYTERVYCFATKDTIVHVGEFPVLTVSGDTIVCNGDVSNVQVSSDIQGCSYDWYQVLGGSTPIQANSATLTTSLSQDRRFYVKVTSPFGCVSWDSVDLYLVNPSLSINKDKICTGDSVKLWAGRAATYEWTASPFDPSFSGQEHNDTIRVSPTQTTTYSVVGHGTNGCGATALSQKITVYPYPIMHVQLTPDYIDSENPSVQFADLSEYGTSSLWNFGNGNTSSTRTVVFTFTDLSQDSILISLVTGNALGCTNDTSFYVPVGIFAVWFPNAFTPKLETNNVFKPFTANDLEGYELFIYDRTGTLVFHSDNIEVGWDGTYKGKDCMTGTYVYIANYRRPGVDRQMSHKGTVTLLK